MCQQLKIIFMHKNSKINLIIITKKTVKSKACLEISRYLRNDFLNNENIYNTAENLTMKYINFNNLWDTREKLQFIYVQDEVGVYSLRGP